jgi:outer membrane protein OmpA-like peptidoglycan-associated protein
MEYNLELSEKRAKAVYDAIIERGDINPNRLRYRGLSYMNPQASNSTEQGRAQNRRTIFKVLNK